MVIPLSNIKPGQSARIVCLANEGLMAGRLEDLGFLPGAVVSCVLQRPRKNIAAYLVRGAVIALREEDSRFIMAKELSPENPVPTTGPTVARKVSQENQPTVVSAAPRKSLHEVGL